jgi:hypothetical protein
MNAPRSRTLEYRPGALAQVTLTTPPAVLVQFVGDQRVTRVPYLVRGTEEVVLFCWRCMCSQTVPARADVSCDHVLAAAAALDQESQWAA